MAIEQLGEAEPAALVDKAPQLLGDFDQVFELAVQGQRQQLFDADIHQTAPGFFAAEPACGGIEHIRAGLQAVDRFQRQERRVAGDGVE